MMGAKALGLIEFALAGGERGHIAAVSSREPHRHMTQAADADDADAISGLCVHRQRIEDGDTAAQQWPGVREVQSLWQWDRPCPMRANVARKSSPMADDCRLPLWTQMLAARHALPAMHATA